MNKSWK